MASKELIYRARALYKELSYMGREYPDPSYPIQQKLRACFGGYVGAGQGKVQLGIERAEFIKKELLALYKLKKYRAMKNSYYKEDG